MADYGDILLEAVQTVVDGSLNKLEFDKTIICKITSNADADKGEYTVNDGATTFIAYSDNTSYTVGTSVYVNVPNGDFTKQKMITGKYITKKGDYYTYTSPWNNFVDITGDILPDDSPHSIRANNDIDDENWTTDERLQEIELLAPYRIPDGKDYTSIGLKADFKAMLKNTGAEAGTYGIRIYIRTVNKNGSKMGNPYKTYLAELSTMDMIGNPYAFESYYNQQKVFDISGMGELYSVRVTLFQKNDFYTASGELIQKDQKDNIFVNNIYLSLGYSIEDFNGDQVFLYSLNSESYSVDYGRFGEENQKNIKLRWIHKNDEDGSIKACTSMADVGDSARIHWYKYKLDQNVNDDLAGAFWEEILDWRDTFEQDVNLFNYVGEQEVKYKVIVETPVKEYLLRDIETDPAVNRTSTKLAEAQARLESAQEFYSETPTDINQTEVNAAQAAYDDALDEYNNVTEKYLTDIMSIESNIIEFTNERKVADLATLDLIQALHLNVDPDGYKGIYTLYDTSNKIQNSVESRKVRSITAVYESTVTGDKDLDAAESIMWQIPLVNTMIQAPELDKEFTEADEYVVSEDGTYCTITRNGKENAGTIGKSFEHADTQYFRIKDYFTANATNNTIYCYVIKDNKTYQAAAELTFGPLGTNGTDFTFLLKMETDRTCVYGLDNDPLRVDAVLYDFNNDEVPHAQNAKINYSWWSQDEITKIGFCTVDGILLDSDGKEIKVDDENLSGKKLLRNYSPDVDETSDTHMCCWIRRLTDTEIKTLNGLSTFDTSVDRVPFFYIMEAQIKINVLSTTKNLGKVILNTYLPIPYAANYQYTQIEGADRVVYNSVGTGRTFYENNYVLYCGNNPVEDTIWKEANEAETIEELKFYPVVEDDGKLVPSATYVNGLKRQVAAVAYADLGDKKRGAIRWTQPIAILQNAYNSAMLNAWDGSLTIDEENDTIMSAMVGAGYKDEYNRFNGVLMGDVKSKVDTAADTGLFGYSEGVQSFGFKTDGTAFIGKSGKGQIQFNGTSGIIQSMSYTQGRTGMKIDLDDGVIEMRGNEIETVENVKHVDIVAVADFTESLNDIYYYIDNKKIKASSNPELYSAMQTLHNCNGKSVKELSEAEILKAEAALNYIRKTVDAVEFKSNSLDNYLSTKKTEYTDYITFLNNSITSNNQLKASLKNTTADKEDAAELDKLNEEAQQEIERYQQLIKELDNYQNVVKDIDQYKEISKLNQQKLDISNQYSAAVSKVEELKKEISREEARKRIITTRKDAAKTKYDGYTANDTSSDKAEDILNSKAKKDTKNILYNEYLELKDEESTITALITELTKQKESIEKQKKSLDQQLSSTNANIESAKNKLVIKSNYESIIDASDILAANGGNAASAEYKQAVQEAYYELLSSTDKTSILPTQLVNTTTTTPTYKKTKAQVRLATVSPYLQLVDSKGYSLLEASDKRYYLQSSGYSDSTEVDGSGGKGVKFDLLNGKLTGYNFSFKTALSSFKDDDPEANKYNGSYVSLSSLGTNANPFFRVHYVIEDEDININLLDITRNNFVLHSQDWNGSSSGLELNLTKGKLRAFSGFDLKAGDDNTYIRLSDSGSPYLQIVQDSKKLMNITTKSFVLQSLDWVEGSAGMQIDLTKGRIKSFSDFDLKTTITSGTYKDSYIRLGTSTSAFAFIIHYKNSEKNQNLDLLKITHNKFLMQSHDWKVGESGVQFNMETGKINAYSFTIKAYRAGINPIDTTQYIAIDSTAKVDGYPIRVEGKDSDGNTKYFRVHWTGQADMNYLNATEGKIGPFNFTTDRMYTGSTEFKGSGIYMDSTGKFSFNGDGFIGGTVTISGTTNIENTLKVTGTTDITSDLHIHGNTDIGGNLTVYGTTKFVGATNITSGSGSAGGGSGTGYIGGSGYSGGTSGGGWGFGPDGGHVGPWIFTEEKFYTTTGSELGASGTIKLDNGNTSMTLTDTDFNVSSGDGSSLTVQAGKLILDGTGDAKITVFSDYMSLKSGDAAIWLGNQTESYIKDGKSKLQLGENVFLLGSGGAKISLSGGTTLELSNDGLTVDGKTCMEDQTINISKMFWKSSNVKLTFHKGLLISEENDGADYTPTSYDFNKQVNITGDLTVKGHIKAYKPGSSSGEVALGKLAFVDYVKKKISVTHKVKVKYSTRGGSVSYSGTAYGYVITDSEGKYVGFNTSGSTDTGQSASRVGIDYSGSKSYSGSSGSKDITLTHNYGEIQFVPSDTTTGDSESLTYTFSDISI